MEGALYNAGQSCCAIERVYVHSSLYESFIEKTHKKISNYVLGNPMESCTMMGPMALPDTPLLLKQSVDSAVSSGAELVNGGNIINDSTGKGRFFEPTLIRECRNDMNIMVIRSI